MLHFLRWLLNKSFKKIQIEILFWDIVSIKRCCRKCFTRDILNTVNVPLYAVCCRRWLLSTGPPSTIGRSTYSYFWWVEPTCTPRTLTEKPRYTGPPRYDHSGLLTLLKFIQAYFLNILMVRWIHSIIVPHTLSVKKHSKTQLHIIDQICTPQYFMLINTEFKLFVSCFNRRAV